MPETTKNKANLEHRDEFRKIPSLDFLYEVNQDGTILRNVKSKKRLKCFLKSHNSKTEYWCTNVWIKHKSRKLFLHNAVAECWLGKKPEGYQVDHIDRNSLNNHYSNLRYVTKSEQMLNRDYDLFMDKLMVNLKKGNGCGTMQPIVLIKDSERLMFPSTRKASKYLSLVYPYKKAKSFQDKFYLKRSRIFDYDVEYLPRCAETRHGNHNW